MRSGQTTLELDDSPASQDSEGHLIPRPKLVPALPHRLKARLVDELDAHGGEHDVSTQWDVPTVEFRHDPAWAKPDGLRRRPLGHLLDKEAEALRKVEVLGEISADLKPGHAA